MHINRPTNFQQLMELSISDLARLDTGLTDVTLVPDSGEKVTLEITVLMSLTMFMNMVNTEQSAHITHLCHHGRCQTCSRPAVRPR